jgi:hypothetical protein
MASGPESSDPTDEADAASADNDADAASADNNANADPADTDVVARLRAALIARTRADPAVDLLPTALATAYADVLAVDGAGLSVFSEPVRVPLGASSSDAATAERLQFTVGEGPCIQALHDQTEIRVSDDDMRRRWPVFYDELILRTPYRSVASLPLRISPGLEGAIDLYFQDPLAAFTVDLNAATRAAGYVAETLRATSAPTVPSVRTADVLVPAWLHSPAAAQRLRTWIATGVVIAQTGLTGPDALTRIRAYAYSEQQDLTDVTDAIIAGTLTI